MWVLLVAHVIACPLLPDGVSELAHFPMADVEKVSPSMTIVLEKRRVRQGLTNKRTA